MVFARKNILQRKCHNSKLAADLLHEFTYTTVDHIHSTLIYMYMYIPMSIIYMYIIMYTQSKRSNKYGDIS